MIDALHISSSALHANQAWLDQIANNVANMQTPGFKKSQVQFADLVHSTGATDNTGGNATAAEQRVDGAGTRLRDSFIVFSEGPVKATNNPLDLAIQGNGFLEVVLPSGELAYTRLGALHVDNEGRLLTRTGLNLSADIRIPPDAEAIEVDRFGLVRARIANSSDILELGQLNLAHFSNAESLQALGDATFRATETSGAAQITQAGRDGNGMFLQGYLEMANVDMVEEMSSMMLAQRAYQLNARVLQASDQVLETINNLRR